MAGKPVYKLLQEREQTVTRAQVYASTGSLRPMEERRPYLDEIRRMGIDAVKIRVKYDTLEEDLAIVRGVRAAVGDGFMIGVDANQGWPVSLFRRNPDWDLERATAFARGCDEQFVLPKAVPEGLVINLAALRMYYFPKVAKDEPRQVLTFPIGIGKVGWATPEGTTKIVSKRKDPWWELPASVRKEHAANGDPLPARVPPGPDNPLGAYAMYLAWPSLLIHGTNKPPGVGMRASHGCIRLYPEDIAAIFPAVPIGTRVTVVNQPLLYGWQDGTLFVQSYPPVVEGKDDSAEPPPVVFDDER